MEVTFHIIGDAFVDFFSFLDGDWPETGGDSRLSEPVQTFAGGSSVNTATHLQFLIRQLKKDEMERVVLHTILNPNDSYGQLLLNHAHEQGFPLVNCRSPDDPSWTGHCIAIISGGDRSFMTHQGCVENFSADNIKLGEIIQTDGPIHLHVAGYFNLTKFWNGKLAAVCARIRDERQRLYPHHSTRISLVTQHDASRQWDGGLDDLIPYLDAIIMNELEASRIVRRGRGYKEDQPGGDCISEWMSFFSSLNPNACFIVTKGSDGAVAFRDNATVATLGPAVPVQVVDPTGAGDAFAAGFLYGVWNSKEDDEPVAGPLSASAVKHGLQWGCSAGTSGVTIRGASQPAELQDILEIYERQQANDKE